MCLVLDQFLWGHSSRVCDISCSSLSYDVAYGSEITSCNKIDKPPEVYRISGNVMMSLTL